MKILPGRLAIVLALAFVAIAVGAVLIPSSPAGIECGNLVSPDWTDEQTGGLLRQTGDLGSYISRSTGYNEKCEGAAAPAQSLTAFQEVRLWSHRWRCRSSSGALDGGRSPTTPEHR